MRVLVTGREGQVVRALLAAGPRHGVEIVALGRPELDLATPGTVAATITAARPDIVVNAAAYTTVDKAESEEALAQTINGIAAGQVAAAAASLDVPVIQISTDYVFDGTKDGRYVETDPVAPINTYGRTKLAGEQTTAAANPRHAILRTSWVYAPEGKNFVRTMLTLAATRSELGVVADQFGAPSYAPDIADAILRLAPQLIGPGPAERYGVFHMTGGGETSWAGFAAEIFRLSAAMGGPSARINPILASAYPTPARRPANSRLDCSKLSSIHGIVMPDWTDALARCMRGMTKDHTA